jgi:hypothetical protein
MPSWFMASPSHTDDVELQRDAAALVHPVLDLLGDGVQMHVPGYELVVRVGHTDERPVGISTPDTESTKKRTVRSPRRTRVNAATDTFQDDSRGETDQTKDQASP